MTTRESTDSPAPGAPAGPGAPPALWPAGVPRWADRLNFAALALFQIVVRAGWIFKTESIVMPRAVDAISGAGWIRGLLPLLNRFGHAVPPLFAAPGIAIAPQKKWPLTRTTVEMAALFVVLTLLFWSGWTTTRPTLSVVVFLVVYTAFFGLIGINQLAFNTVQAKLVVVNRRGRLLAVSNLLGGVIAITFALVLFPNWLVPSPRFDMIFGFSALLFFLAALAVVVLVELPDRVAATRRSVVATFADAWNVLRHDRPFRRVAICSGFFSCSIMLFPHYQSLGRVALGHDDLSLMWWVIVQNIGTALFSVPAGRWADGRGNRLVLRVLMLGIVAAPLSAIGLIHLPNAAGYYHAVFLLVGLTPVVFRTFQNLTVEFAPAELHPCYLATLGLVMAVPMVLSPAVGWMIDSWGFESGFLAVTLLIASGWGMTWFLDEPRFRGAHADQPLEPE